MPAAWLAISIPQDKVSGFLARGAETQRLHLLRMDGTKGRPRDGSKGSCLRGTRLQKYEKFYGLQKGGVRWAPVHKDRHRRPQGGHGGQGSGVRV